MNGCFWQLFVFTYNLLENRHIDHVTPLTMFWFLYYKISKLHVSVRLFSNSEKKNKKNNKRQNVERTSVTHSPKMYRCHFSHHISDAQQYRIYF